MRTGILIIGVFLLGVLIISGCVPSGVWLHHRDPPPLIFTPRIVPEGQVGTPYSVTITVTGGPIRYIRCDTGFSGRGLPDGLMARRDEAGNSVTISGTPTEPGAFSFCISAGCFGTQRRGASGSCPYQLTIAPPEGDPPSAGVGRGDAFVDDIRSRTMN